MPKTETPKVETPTEAKSNSWRADFLRQISEEKRVKEADANVDDLGIPRTKDDLLAGAEAAEQKKARIAGFPDQRVKKAEERLGSKVQSFRNLSELVTERSKHKGGTPEYNRLTNEINNAKVSHIVRNDPEGLRYKYASTNDLTGRKELGAGGSLEARMADIIPGLANGKPPKRYAYSRDNISLGASDEESLLIAGAMGRTDVIKNYEQNGRQAFSGTGFQSIPGLNLTQRHLANDTTKGKFRPNDFIKRLEGYEEYDQSALAPPVPTRGRFMSRPNRALAKERRKFDAFFVGPQTEKEIVGPPDPNPKPYNSFDDPRHVQGVVDTISDYGIPALRALRERADLTSAIKADGQLADHRNDQTPIVLAGNEMFSNVAAGSGPTRSIQSAPNLTDIEDGDGSDLMLQGNILDDLSRDRSAVAADKSVEKFMKTVGPEYESFARQWVADNQDRINSMSSSDSVAQAALGDWINYISDQERIAGPTSPFASHYSYFDEKPGVIRSFAPEDVPSHLRGDYMETAKGLADEASRSLVEGTFDKSISDGMATNIQLGTIADLNRLKSNFEAYGRASDAIKGRMIARDELVAQKIANGEPLTDEDVMNTSLQIAGEEPSYFNAADALALTTAAQYQKGSKNYRKVYGKNYDEEVDRDVPLTPEEEARRIANMNDVDGDDGYREQVRVFGSPQENFVASVKSAKRVSKDTTDIDIAEWDSVRNARLMNDGSIAMTSKTSYRPDVDKKIIDTLNDDDGTYNSLVLTIDFNGTEKGQKLSDDDGDYIVGQLRGAGYAAGYDSTNGTIEIVKENGRPPDEWLRSIDDTITRQVRLSVNNGDVGELRLDIGRTYTQQAEEYGADLSQHLEAKRPEVRSGLGSRARRSRA